MPKFQVIGAAYGALIGGSSDHPGARDVTAALQKFLDESENGIIGINNAAFGDPAPDNLKHFGAVIKVDGKIQAFACQEGQNIDFS